MASTSANIASDQELATCPTTSATPLLLKILHYLQDRQSLKRSGAFEDPPLSSSSSGRPPKRVKKVPYDIFINHRGPDVKKGLATDLYKTLNDAGLRVFLDSPELEWGDSFPEEIKCAMKSSSLHLAIFSENYAQSSWCLAELSFMLKTDTKIVPVFYHVKIEDVRYAKGVYAEAFSRYEQKGRYSSTTLQEWKDALRNVSQMVGHIIHTEDDETKLLKNITDCAVKMIKTVPQFVVKHEVGLDEAVEDFEMKTFQSVEGHSAVQVVGIWGMGGVGKTTLAKKIYNNKYKTMERCSFLFDVRDAAHKSVLHIKQRKLLEDLGFKDEKSAKIENVEEGKGILAKHLRSVRVFIVLDDVDNVEQLDALVPEKSNFRQGSLIVVTTRQSDVLTGWGISFSSVYKMEGLNPSHSKQLFCRHAFLQPFPKNGFAELVEKFVDACGRLPLSLKVVGAQLCGKSEQNYWESQLEKIKRILPGEIIKCLRVSYDALDNEEKEAFLDAACFFNGEHKSLAIEVWNGPERSGSEKKGLCNWETLVNRCFVEVDEMHYIKMHDHLRDLGREISLEQPPYRLLFPSQTINVGKQVEKVMGIRGIVATSTRVKGNSMVKTYLRMESSDEEGENGMCISDGKLMVSTSQGIRIAASLVGLKIIVVEGTYFQQIIAEVSRNLVWLRWFDIGQKNLSCFSFKNLRVLELYEDSYAEENHLKELWADVDAPTQLRELVISGCIKFQRFPESIGLLKHLKKILLVIDEFCGSVRRRIELKSLPEEFCRLQSLEHLEFRYCEVSSLPDSFGDLRNLRYLCLAYCDELVMLPASFKKLTLLQHLELEGCGLPTLEKDILIGMTKLKYLNLSECLQMEELPHITNLVSLEELHLDFLLSLRELPINIGQVSKLREMISTSFKLTSLPTSLGDLSSLTKLFLKCTRLKCLPTTLGDLSKLICLEIVLCSQLEYLPKSVGQLINLQKLYIESCPISDLNLGVRSFESSLYNLKEITVAGAKVPKLSISQECCPGLESLRIEDDKVLTDIEVLPITVSDLWLSNCSELRNIKAVGGVVNIKTLRIIQCPELDVLPSLAQLISLQIFELDGSDKVKEIQGLEHCRSLEEFTVKTKSEVSGLDHLECTEKSRRVDVGARSRSSVEGCIRKMQKMPKETIVRIRAIPDAASRLRFWFLSGSLFDSRFSLPPWYVKDVWGALEQKLSPNDAIIVCFVLDSYHCKHLQIDGPQHCSPHPVDKGKGVWMALLTQHSRWNNVEAVRNLSRDAEAEGGLLIRGEDHALKGTFLDLLTLLSE